MDRDSPAAKNQRLADSFGPEPPTSDAASNGHMSPASQGSDGPELEAHESPAGHEQHSRLSGSQVDGQLDDDCMTDNQGSSSHIRSSPDSPKGPEVTKEDSDPEKVEPEKSKIPDTSAVDAAAARERNSIYHVKWIGWRRNSNDAMRRVGIMTQNENGPCPLLSIVNVLILRGKLSLPEGCEVISAEQLLEFLGEIIAESVPSHVSEDARLNYEQNIADAMCTLPKLQTGLDVNVHFIGVSRFEYTPECIIFDLLDIPLYHGWLIDPQQEEVCAAVNSASYNQLVEMIIANKSSTDSELMSHSITAQQFLEESASQLTYHGLYELNATMKDGELAVFFRNNHFSTIYKWKQELFLLVTDQGFLKEPRVVWETLNTIDGDIQFVNENFMTVSTTSDDDAGVGVDEPHPDALAAVAAGGGQNEEQIDRDLQYAMSLASQEETEVGEWEEFKRAHLGDTTGLSDEELAKRLQEAEEQLAAQAAQQQQQQQGEQPRPGGSREGPRGPRGQGHGRRSPQRSEKSKNCAIL